MAVKYTTAKNRIKFSLLLGKNKRHLTVFGGNDSLTLRLSRAEALRLAADIIQSLS